MATIDRVTAEQRDIGAPGTATQPLLRLTDPMYADGMAAMREGASAAEVAHTLFAQHGADIPEPGGLSALWVIWGQVLDHDIDLTPEGGTEPIDVDGLVAPFVRSVYDPGTGHDPATPRQQMNTVTALIDGSQLYGSDSERLAALRAFEGGRMLASERVGGVELLPVNAAGLPNAGDTDPDNPKFLAGDVRANENAALTSLQTLLLNEHNHWAARLAAEHPDWSDETLFQGARSVVEALIQHVSYDEFLPKLIGPAALPALAASAGGIDPQIATEFSTAAYRFGHSMVAPLLLRLEEDGAASADGPLSLRDAFFDNSAIREDGISGLIRGLAGVTAQALDTKVIDDLNFFLEGPDGMQGFSLAALNIMRGRDHGLETYVEARSDLVGDIDPAAVPAGAFDLITDDLEVQQALAAVYDSVQDVDFWVGGLAEEPVDGGIVGPLFEQVLVDQFTRLRDGDPLWYERRDWLDDHLLEEVQATRLADVLMRSGGVDHVQRDAFLTSERTGGSDRRDVLRGDDGRDLLIGFGGHDRLRGGGGDDDLFGDDGNDELRGEAGNDALTGGVGFDRLFGGAGNDWLCGEEGMDRLRGGPGADQFVFLATDTVFDVLEDFQAGDTLVFQGFGDARDHVRILYGSDEAMVWLDMDLVVQVNGQIDRLDPSDFQFVG